MKPGGETLNEFPIILAGAAPQLVIQMTDNEPPISSCNKQMQERDRIAPAGDAYEVRPGGWKLLKNPYRKIRMSRLPALHFFKCRGARRGERLQINEYLTMNERSFISAA
jgi:hypothetical protein